VWVRPMARTQAVAGGAALLAALVLGGCSSDATSTSSPTPTPSETSTSASPSPSRSTTPTPSESSTIPAAARKNTPEGAEAFVRFFVSQSARAWVEADSGPVTALSDADCASCATLAERADELKDARQRYEDAPIEVKSVRALTRDDRRINVAASIKQRRVNVVDEGGKVVSTDKADDLTRTFLLYWEGGQWLVGGIA
jgi:hypothetical protein